MSFKIINPGYGYLVDPTFTTVHSSVYNPRFGVAFYGGSTLDGEGYIIPALGYGGLLCFKFDVYIPEEDFSTYFGLGVFGYGGYCALFQIGYYRDSHYLTSYLGNEELTVDSEDSGDFFKFGAVNTIWIRLRLEDEFSEDSECTIKVNGKNVAEYADFDTGAKSVDRFHIAVDAKTPISNLIISDEHIDPNENIFRVSRRNYGDFAMAKKDGYYERTFWNGWKFITSGYVLQELNTKKLYSAVDSDGKVLGMAAIAAPAYNTGEEPAKANCMVRRGANTTNYASQNLSSDTSGVLIEYLPVTSDTTFASLNGLQVGWFVDKGSV